MKLSRMSSHSYSSSYREEEGVPDAEEGQLGEWRRGSQGTPLFPFGHQGKLKAPVNPFRSGKDEMSLVTDIF